MHSTHVTQLYSIMRHTSNLLMNSLSGTSSVPLAFYKLVLSAEIEHVIWRSAHICTFLYFDTRNHLFTITAALSLCTHADKVVSSHLDKSVKIWSLPSCSSVVTNTEHVVGQRSDYHQIMAMAKMDQYLFTGKGCALFHPLL